MKDWNVNHHHVVDFSGFARPGKSSHPKIKDGCHYGKPLLNGLLNKLRTCRMTGMVGFVDDDTIVPESLADAFLMFMREWPAKKAFTVQQVDKSGKIRIDVKQNPRRIDQGCYFIHTDLIGSHRFYAEPGGDAKRFYEADGEFYHRVRRETSDQWIDLPIVGSIYNALR